MPKFRATTILAVKKNGKIALGGDGQVSFGETVLKSGAGKLRKLQDGKVILGFAGATGDAFTLMERFETKLAEFPENLSRAAIELAKAWRTDKILQKLEAMMIVADKTTVLLLSGSGDVIEPDDGVVGIGSGGQFAVAAARALARHTDLAAAEIVREAMKIAAEICVYTNDKINILEL